MNRRTVAAGCLVASPVLHSASYFLWPADSEGTHAQQLAAAGAHAGAWSLATWVETVGWLLLVPALVVIWMEARGRGRGLTAAGAWIAILGMFGFFGAGVMNLVTIELGRQPSQSAMLSLMDAMKKDGGLFLLVVLPILAGTLALVAMLAGLSRAAVLGWWAPAAAFVAVVASEALSESANPVLLTAAFAPLAAGFVATARALTREPAPIAGQAGLASSPSTASVS